MLKNYPLLLTAAIILCFNSLKSQASFNFEAPQYDNSTSSSVAPEGWDPYMRGCFLVTASELAGISTVGSTTISSLTFTINAGQSGGSAIPGNFIIYLQNTNDVSFNKSTTFATALTGMTTVYSGPYVTPTSPIATSVTLTFNSGTPFIYNGGGLYVAYTYTTTSSFMNFVPPLFRCNSALNPGGVCSSGNPAPAVLAYSPQRPCFLFGAVNTYTNDIAIVSVNAPGKIASPINPTHSITTVIKNLSNQLKINVVVTANVSGANTFANTQTVSAIAAGATATVTFLPFSPTLGGLNNISVTVPSDERNTNNGGTSTQSVNCNVWSASPPNVPYTGGAVGFLNAGIISMLYKSANTETLTGINGAISTNLANSLNKMYGVVMDNTGAILATTNTITLTNAMLGTFLPFTFSSSLILSPNTAYYIGYAQQSGGWQYFPFGTNTVTPGTGTFYSSGPNGGIQGLAISGAGYFGIDAVFATTVTIPALINSPTITCGGGAVLTATTNATSYTWTAGPTNTSYVVSPMANTVYTLTVANAMGCTKTHTTQVTINLPITATSNPPAICAGSSSIVVLTASGANSYTWNTPPSPIVNSTFTTSLNGTTVYTVQGTNNAGCIGTAVVTVAVNSFTNLVVSANGGQACAGQTFTASANGGVTYTWTTGTATLNTASISQSVTANTTYTVSGTDVNGCKASTVIPVTINPSPTITATSATINCGGTATLTATSSDPYNWTNGPANSDYVVTPLVNTAYSVTSTNVFNCSVSKSVFVIVNPIPLTVTSNTPSICMGNTVVITAGGATSYSWNVSPSITANSFMANPAITTTYVVTGTNAAGCSGNAVVIVYVYDCTVGIEKNSLNNSLLVYPNPFKNNVTISFENETGAKDIILMNLLGETILHIKNADKTTQLDLSNQANGVYFIVMEQDGKPVRTVKAVKRD